VHWVPISVTRVIEWSIPYVIVYPTFEFYWKRVSVTVSVRIGFIHISRTITFHVPAIHVVWHVKIGVLHFKRVIRYVIRIPIIHLQAIFRHIPDVVHHAALAAGHAAGRAVKAIRHSMGRALGAAAGHGDGGAHEDGHHGGGLFGTLRGAANRGWHVVRFVKNLPSTTVGFVAAEADHGHCHWAPGLMVQCSSARWSPRGGIDIGNVFITTDDRSDIDSALMSHEAKHADQWAIFGNLHFPALYGGASIEEKVRGLIQGPAPNCTDKTACYNIFEQWAGLADGRYVAHGGSGSW
jgi:hypothetical protein